MWLGYESLLPFDSWPTFFSHGVEVNEFINCPDNKVHGANMGPTWVLLAPGGPHVGPINFSIRVCLNSLHGEDTVLTFTAPPCFETPFYFNVSEELSYFQTQWMCCLLVCDQLIPIKNNLHESINFFLSCHGTCKGVHTLHCSYSALLQHQSLSIWRNTFEIWCASVPWNNVWCGILPNFLQFEMLDWGLVWEAWYRWKLHHLVQRKLDGTCSNMKYNAVICLTNWP